MQAKYTLINHNAWSVTFGSVTVAPRGKVERYLDLTAEHVTLLNKQKMDVIVVIGGRKFANADIFATPALPPSETVEVPAPAVDPEPEPVVVATVSAASDEDEAEPETVVSDDIAVATEDDSNDVVAVVTDGRSARTEELMAMNGNTLKAMAKKDPYGFTGIDGLSKSDIVEKLVEFEFSTPASA